MDNEQYSSSRSSANLSFVLPETCAPRSPSPSPIRIRKRARMDEDEVVMQLRPKSKFETELVRDDTYYLSDGSFILQVENTVFNVHRTILAKDFSTFSAMFDMPVPEGEEEYQVGSSDDNPLVLTGDTVKEFKNFLWALYSLPHELMIVHSPKADLSQLMDIARIANKYSFRSLETWALDAINDHVNRKPSPLYTFLPYSTSHADTKVAVAANGALVSRLVHLAQICNHEQLLSTMILLLKQLMSLSIQYAYLAMTLADELDLRALRGVAYLEVMQKAVVVTRAKDRPSSEDGNEPSAEDSEGGIVDCQGRLIVSQEQRLRLLSGYYRLSRAWERLRVQPLHFEHSASCSTTWHQHGCTQSWQDFWKEKTRGDSVLSLGLADVLGRLKAIAKEFDRWSSATYMHHDCRVIARKTIMEKIKQVEDALPDYFMDDLE